MDRIKSNFVIFSQPRTGSGTLCKNLNSQKDIMCMREVFNKKWDESLGPQTKKQFKKYFGNNYIGILREIRRKNFTEFLMLMSEISNKPVFGYKIMAKHTEFFKNKELYLNYLKNNKSKIILLTRDNSLLKYVSYRTCKEIGTYSSRPDHPKQKIIYQLNPIRINYNQYKEYINQENLDLEERKKDILLYKLPHIHIKYEDLFGEKYLESMAKIYELLNLDFKDFKDFRESDGTILGHKKINVYNIKDKIINYQAFKKQAEDNNDAETLNFLE
jgi:LPS sulfotransferase NodH